MSTGQNIVKLRRLLSSDPDPGGEKIPDPTREKNRMRSSTDPYPAKILIRPDITIPIFIIMGKENIQQYMQYGP